MHKSQSIKSLVKESPSPSTSNGKLAYDDNDGNEFLEQLKCPICVEIPLGEIFQCKNGHTLCHTCVRSVKVCPQCRIHFERDGGLIRVRALESLVDSIKVACPHKSDGCMEKVARKDLKVHERNCLYNGKCIQLCKILGYNCNYWTNDLNPESTAAHFQNKHKAVVVNGDSVDIEITNFKNVAAYPDADGLWSPIIVNTSDGLHFVILVFFNAEDVSVSWACLKINHENDSEMKSEIELHIENRSYKPLPLKCKIFPVPLLELTNIDINELIPQRILAKTLNEKYVRCYMGKNVKEEGTLPLHIQVSSSPLLKQEVKGNWYPDIRRMSKQGATTPPITISEIIARKKEQEIFKPMWIKLNEQYEILKKSFGFLQIEDTK